MYIFNVLYMTDTYRAPPSLVTQNSMYFPGYFQVKAIKSQVNLALNHSVVDNVDITKIEMIFFVNGILKGKS